MVRLGHVVYIWYDVISFSNVLFSLGKFERSETQNSIRDQAVSELSLPRLPTSLYNVAYQPVACGGPVHFTAGIIRIVMKARELVKNEAERDKVTQGLEWGDKEWKNFLIDHFGLQEGFNPNEERLLIMDQKVYRCRCSALI